MSPVKTGIPGPGSSLKLPGWFSRRHRDNQAHIPAMSNWNRSRRRDRQYRAYLREEARFLRSPAEQLQLLDDRLGIGLGAERERARLQAMIDETYVPKAAPVGAAAMSKDERRRLAVLQADSLPHQ